MVAFDPRGGFAADVAAPGELVVLPVLTAEDRRARIVVARWSAAWQSYLPRASRGRWALR